MNSTNGRKTILIVSMRKKPAVFIKNILQAVLAKEVSISTFSFSLDEIVTLTEQLGENPDVIIASGEFSYGKITEIMPIDKVLQATREVSEPEFFDRLFLIPKGKEVLVVNETESGTMETIQSLQMLGITHLKYLPFWLGCRIDYTSIDTAISPGMLDVCPESIPNKIDIGMRTLSIPFFLKLLDALKLEHTYLDNYIFNQKRLLISTYKKLSMEFMRAEKLKNSLQNIIDGLDEAIIGINKQNNVTQFNMASERLLGIPRERALNKNLYGIFKDTHNIDKVLIAKSQDNKIIKIGGKPVYVSFMPIYMDNLTEGIFTMREVHEFQKKEEQLRRILHKGDVEFQAKYTINDIVYRCDEMRDLIDTTKDIATTDSIVLLTGDSGTGKEVFAQSLHNLSARKRHPFIAVNIAALNDNLIESELFGYEEGAFTGAKRSGKKGLFELAHNGTLFLDEIGDSSLWVQSRLLRVLEEKEVMRMGDTKIIPIDVRVVVATNKNLKKLVEQGKFREDLYYRLNIFQLHIPPLRERTQDIEALTASFMASADIKLAFSPEALECIRAYDWPGNIRELKNMVDYVGYKAKGKVIEKTDLPYDVLHPTQLKQAVRSCDATLLDCLSETFEPGLVQETLRAISEYGASPFSAGRNRIKNDLLARGIAITDSKLRTLYKYLKKLRLIGVGKTKQGTRITDKGEDFLKNLRSGTA